MTRKDKIRNISENEGTVESEDSEGEINQPSSEERDDVTHESMDDSPAANSQNALRRIENELTDSNTEESDGEDSTGSRPNNLMAKNSFKGINDSVWVTT